MIQTKKEKSVQTLIRLLSLCCFFLVAQGCNMINPTEVTPTYVRIDSFKMEPTPQTGSISHNITSVWVYFNNQTVGAYDLPASVPILADAPGEVLVVPGISYSGLSSIQAPYPFYLSDKMALSPAPGEDVRFNPVTRYLDYDLLSMVQEDFEFGNSFIVYDGDTLRATSEPGKVFEGSRSGEVRIDSAGIYEHILSIPFIINGTEAYVELDMKSSARVEIGFQTSDQQGRLFIEYLYGLYPREEWNKVYIGMQEFLSMYYGRQYRLAIKTITDKPSGGYLLLDNIKIISKK